jgi:Zn finger protein HypA/HybF involved in hydrogenase expression
MRVRCGACRTQFEVSGAGRFACPVCGSVNVVRNGGGASGGPAAEPPPQAQSGMGGYQAAPGVVPGGPPPQQQQRPPEPEQPMPKIECPECAFTFIVGQVATVTCPMCSAEVSTGIEEDDTE